MTDVTRILSQIEQGDPSAADELLPLVYEELRKLTAAKSAEVYRPTAIQSCSTTLRLDKPSQLSVLIGCWR